MIFTKDNFNSKNFNKELVDIVGNRLDNNCYEDAVKQALLFLTDIFRNKTELTEDGVSLVSKALSISNPLIKINNLSNDTEINEQKGVMFLSQGAYAAFRNPLNHSIHTKITEKDCMRQLVIIDMVLDYITRDIKEKSTISNALFDVVNDNNKEFYLNREIDIQVEKSLILDNVWLYGESGVGKTNSAIYYTLNHQTKFSHTVYFSDIENYMIDTITKNIFESLCDIVESAEIDLSSIDISKSNEKKELIKLICILLNHFSNVILIFDDIPEFTNDEFQDFFQLLLTLQKSHSNPSACNSQNLRLVMTSIVNPLENFADMDVRKKEKLEETLKFISFNNWENSEIIGLKNHIESFVGDIISDDDAISGSKEKPRKLKRIMKDIVSGGM